ncbi:MAG: hypothetical protein NXH90_13610 [Flavobacteriaceae bacterium]|nr:hypothetical protein [Flavobacteriaceae bacterium]
MGKKSMWQLKEERLGKGFESLRIDELDTDNPIVFIEEHNIEKCIEAIEKLQATSIYTQTGNIGFLGKPVFKNIKVLNIYAREDSNLDLTVTYHMKQLTKLQVTYFYEGTIDFSHFPELTEVKLRLGKKTKNFGTLVNLKKAYLSCPDFEDLSTFGNLSKLKSLELTNMVQCKSLNGISGLIKLTELTISEAPNLKSLDGLETLSNTLVKLKINETSVNDISPIGKLKKLKTVELSRFKEIMDMSPLGELEKLNSIHLGIIQKCNSLGFLARLPKLKKLTILPWQVKVEQGYLPLTQKLNALGELKKIINWEGVLPHLDEAGKAFYNNHFNVSPLQFIKNEFDFFDNYEDYGEPYTKENCNKVNTIIYNLIDRLEENNGADEPEKLEIIKASVLGLNDLNDSIEGFIETGERETLCDILDEIATKAGIDVAQFDDGDLFESGIASQWRTW